MRFPLVFIGNNIELMGDPRKFLEWNPAGSNEGSSDVPDMMSPQRIWQGIFGIVYDGAWCSPNEKYLVLKQPGVTPGWIKITSFVLVCKQSDSLSMDFLAELIHFLHLCTHLFCLDQT